MISSQIWGKIKSGVFIIAEAGKNFIQTQEERPVLEYLKNAKALVDQAVLAGADAIKFQTHNVEDEQLNIKITSPHFKSVDRYNWLTRNTNATPVEDFWRPLKDYCNQKGIVFMSTPMSRGAAKRLSEVGVPIWKIGSGDILDFVAMDYMRTTGLPIIMSSGMSTLEEVERGFNFLRAKNKHVALMHCLSKYPGLPEEANLAVMELYREKFSGTPVGFSENSLGIEPSIFAVALGATIIEKHFTLNRDLWGSDHKVSSTPEEFKKMVQAIRLLENNPEKKAELLKSPIVAAVKGLKEKNLKEDERVFRPLFRKTLVAGREIKAGESITAEMLYAMRPQKYALGLPSEKYEEVLGKITAKDLEKYEPINETVLL